jgi:hypothetical protein
MRSVGLTLAIVFVTHGISTAQSVNGALFRAAVEAPAARTLVIEPAPPPRPAAISNLLFDSDRHDDPTLAAAQLLERLPFDRLQKRLRGNRPLRMIGTAVGATLITTQLREMNTPALAQIGVQAVRFGASEWLEGCRFRIEPQIMSRGFAISFKQVQR